MVLLRSRSGAAATAVVAWLAAASCKPDVDQRAFAVEGVRVLAVRAEPAEPEPRDQVTFTALVVDPSAPAPAPSWAFCTARKPLAELGPFNPACYGRDPSAFAPLGQGASVAGAIPTSACRDFGPEVPQAKPGEPYGRPVDPDPTGGYYQPVSIFVADRVAVAQVRVSCGVAGASSDDVLTFRQRYHANENPGVARLTFDGVAVDDGGSVAAAPSTAHALGVEWTACPDADRCGDGVCGVDETRASCADDCAKPKGCAGAERYLWFDPEARVLVTRRESIRASWFSTAGVLDEDRTGRAEDERETSTENTWRAPEAPARASIFVVLRDDRGGAAFRTVNVDVRATP